MSESIIYNGDISVKNLTKLSNNYYELICNLNDKILLFKEKMDLLRSGESIPKKSKDKPTIEDKSFEGQLVNNNQRLDELIEIFGYLLTDLDKLI